MCRLIDVRPKDFRFSGIYKLTNTVNGKVYIGQSINIGRRINEYKNGLFNAHMAHAVMHYGIDVLDMDVIERCVPEELDDREAYWIAYYDSTDQSKGYNVCKRSNQMRGVKLSAETRERMRQSMIARMTDEYKAQLSERRKLSNAVTSAPVCQLDRLTGRVLAVFPSISAAAVAVAGQRDCISRACSVQHRGIHAESNGYCWCYAEDANGLDHVDVHAAGTYVGKHGAYTAISQFDRSTGELIAVFPNASCAQEHTGVFATSISACCRSFARGYGKRHSAGGYVWKFATNEDLQAFILTVNKTPNKQAS